MKIRSVISLPLLVACSRTPEPPMLHRLPAFSGDVELRVGDRVAQRFELAFARANGHMQVQAEVAGRGVTLLLGKGGAVSVFEDAVERPPTAAERSLGDLVWTLCNPARIGAVRAAAPHYEASCDGRWYRVILTMPAPDGPHGGR